MPYPVTSRGTKSGKFDVLHCHPFNSEAANLPTPILTSGMGSKSLCAKWETVETNVSLVPVLISIRSRVPMEARRIRFCWCDRFLTRADAREGEDARVWRNGSRPAAVSRSDTRLQPEIFTSR